MKRGTARTASGRTVAWVEPSLPGVADDLVLIAERWDPAPVPPAALETDQPQLF